MPDGAFAVVICHEGDSVLGYELAPYMVDAASSTTHAGRIISPVAGAGATGARRDRPRVEAAAQLAGPAKQRTSAVVLTDSRLDQFSPVSLIVVCRTA
jgi:hypothetical protein